MILLTFSRSFRQNIRTQKLCMVLKFKNPASFIISDRSGVEKTKWILCLVDNIDKICPEINQIFYCYEVWQDIFNEYSDEIRFRQGPLVLNNFK